MRILFGIEQAPEGFRATVVKVKDDKILATKKGAEQLKHHAISIAEHLMANYVVDSYNEPEKFFESVQVR